jgi:glycosyltransferase involved in cell wall biosynthesis
MNQHLVVHVVYNLKIGGLERVVVNLIHGLLDSPYRCLVVCLEQEGELAAEIKSLGIPLFNMSKNPGWDWNCICQLAKLLRNQNVQIVHTHNMPSHFHGGIAALFAGVPVRIHTKHGRDYPEIKKRVLLNRSLSWFTDVIVPVSDNARDVALQIEKVNPKKVKRIWNGVDTQLYRPHETLDTSPWTLDFEKSPKTMVYGPKFPLVIGTVARLSPEKDQKTMLQAFKLILEQATYIRPQTLPLPPFSTSSAPSVVKCSFPLPRLVIVGDGPCRSELEACARELDISGQVDFLGMRSDISTQLSTFDLFTLSSTTEGISMTVLEAMACGLPIVATNVGGNREIIQPPQCGLVVPVANPRALADACLDLLRDPSRRETMGRAARARCVEHFSLRRMVEQYTALYEQLLQRP